MVHIDTKKLDAGLVVATPQPTGFTYYQNDRNAYEVVLTIGNLEQSLEGCNAYVIWTYEDGSTTMQDAVVEPPQTIRHVLSPALLAKAGQVVCTLVVYDEAASYRRTLGQWLCQVLPEAQEPTVPPENPDIPIIQSLLLDAQRLNRETITALGRAEEVEQGTEHARVAAQAAQVAAETAQTGAKAAQTAAEAARDAAATQAATAEGQAAAAAQSAAQADLARADARAAQTGAEAAQTGAEAVRGDLQAKFNELDHHITFSENGTAIVSNAVGIGKEAPETSLLDIGIPARFNGPITFAKDAQIYVESVSGAQDAVRPLAPKILTAKRGSCTLTHSESYNYTKIDLDGIYLESPNCGMRLTDGEIEIVDDFRFVRAYAYLQLQKYDVYFIITHNGKYHQVSPVVENNISYGSAFLQSIYAVKKGDRFALQVGRYGPFTAPLDVAYLSIEAIG